MEEDEALDPIHISLFGANAVVPHPRVATDGIEKSGRASCRGVQKVFYWILNFQLTKSKPDCLPGDQ
jgi:hypothetical protein